MDHIHKISDQVGRGLTYNLWKNFPLHEAVLFRDLNVGYGIYPDLVNFDSAVDAAAATVRYANGARISVDTSCTIAQLTGAQGGHGGGIRLSTTTTDNVEAWIQWGGASGSPFRISNTAGAAKDLVFEFAFRTSTVTDSKAGFFIGLMEEGCAAENTITDAGALADKDYFGIHRLEGDGDAIDIVYKKAGQTAVVHKADWQTIAANTWYHVGFRYDAKSRSITPWFGTGNRSTTPMAADLTNRLVATDISSATDIFPNGEGLAPIIGIKNATNETATLDVRLLCCGQVAIAAD